MTEVEIDELVLMVTNYGASTVLSAIRDISTGFTETQQAILGVTNNDTMLRMWYEISNSITPIVSKVERIEKKYKSLSDSRKLILDAIKRASEKHQE